MILKRRKRTRANIRQEPRIRCPGHLQFVRGHECAVQDSWCVGKVQAAHVRMGTDGALGVKPSDCFAVPLCAHHHHKQHDVGETNFWRVTGKDPLTLAARLWKASPHRYRYEQKQRSA